MGYSKVLFKPLHSIEGNLLFWGLSYVISTPYYWFFSLDDRRLIYLLKQIRTSLQKWDSVEVHDALRINNSVANLQANIQTALNKGILKVNERVSYFFPILKGKRTPPL